MRHIAEAYWAVAMGLVWSCSAPGQETECLQDVVVIPEPAGVERQRTATPSSTMPCHERVLGDNVVAAAWCFKNQQKLMFARARVSSDVPVRRGYSEPIQTALDASAIGIDRLQGDHNAPSGRGVGSSSARPRNNCALINSPSTKCGRAEMLTTAQDALRRRSATSVALRLITSKPDLSGPNGSSC